MLLYMSYIHKIKCENPRSPEDEPRYIHIVISAVYIQFNWTNGQFNLLYVHLEKLYSSRPYLHLYIEFSGWLMNDSEHVGISVFNLLFQPWHDADVRSTVLCWETPRLF